MFRSLFKQRAPDAGALSLAVHSAARHPYFYTDLGVPDSFDGRFELLAIHGHLVIRRLRTDGEGASDLGQALFDALTGHFDEALRAIGVGDMSVGKRVKTMTSALYGRLAAYDAGFDALDSPSPEGGGESVLSDALRRNLYGTVAEPDAAHVQAVTAYVRRAGAHLAGQSYEQIVAGKALFPDPSDGREGS